MDQSRASDVRKGWGMPEGRVIIKSTREALSRLPGSVMLPDGTKPVRLGSGTVTSLLSVGGMAVIYRIWNPELEVSRAVKLLHPDHTKESEDRFHTEMKITAKLHHPNIVEIYAVGKWNDLPYIEMECIEGLTLEEMVGSHGSLPLEVCTSLGIMVGRALNHAHHQSYMIYGKKYEGIIHRDLKPANVMVTNAGVVKLMDFGIAKPTSAGLHTMDGMVVGTLQYLAPEQLDGKETDIRADIYSFGTLLYEMLTGNRVFPESNIAKLVPAKLSNRFTPLEDFKLKIPRRLTNLTHRCLRHEKEKRIQTMLELLRELGRIHKKLTNRSPEQVMARFMKERKKGTDDKKTVASVRRRHPIVPALLWVFTSAALLLTAGFVLYSTILQGKFPWQSPGETKAEWSMIRKTPPVPRRPDASPAPPAKKAPAERREESVTTVSRPPAGASSTARSARPRRRSTVPITRGPTRPRRAKPAAAAPTPPGKRAGEEKQTPAPTPRPPGFVEKMKKQHNTSDLVRIMIAEIDEGRHDNALRLYDHLTPSQAQSGDALLAKFQALEADGSPGKLSRFLKTNNIADGTFYARKALMFLEEGSPSKALSFLSTAERTHTRLTSNEDLQCEIAYRRAQCRSRLFDASGEEATKKDAMEAWFNVKSLLRRNPEHPFYREADSEIRRISAATAQ